MAEAQYLEWCIGTAAKNGYEPPSDSFQRLFREVGRKMGAWNLVVGQWRNNMNLKLAQDTVLWEIVNNIPHQMSVENKLTPLQRQLTEFVTNTLLENRRACHPQILYLHQQGYQPPCTQFEIEIRRFFKTSGPDPSAWRGELYPAIRELETQLIEENKLRAAQQAANALNLPVDNMMLSNAENVAVAVPIAAGPLGFDSAPQNEAMVPEAQLEEAGIQDQAPMSIAGSSIIATTATNDNNALQIGSPIIGLVPAVQYPVVVPETQAGIQDNDHNDVAQGSLAAPPTNWMNGPTLSPFELAKSLFALHQNQRTALGFAPMCAPYAPNAHTPNWTTTSGSPGSSSSSATGYSPFKTPTRGRDKKRDAETKELRNKINDASKLTPINLVFPGSLEFDNRQQDAIKHCKKADVYQHEVYQRVKHLFHRHIFDPTAMPTQLPQVKKNVMLDIRQLYGAWNLEVNKKGRGISNQEWTDMQNTQDTRALQYWQGVTEMLAKEKESQIYAGFITLGEHQKTRNYGRKPEDGAGPAPPMVMPMPDASEDLFAFHGALAADDVSNLMSQSRKRASADRFTPSDDYNSKIAKHTSESNRAE